MAKISISDLIGFDLLSDDETFLNDLSSNELDIAGGLNPVFAKTITLTIAPTLRTPSIRPTPAVVTDL